MSNPFYVHDIPPFIGELASLAYDLESAVHGPGHPADLFGLIKEVRAKLADADHYLEKLDPTTELAKQLRTAMQRAQAELKNATAEVD